jgi:hypothetical protein
VRERIVTRTRLESERPFAATGRSVGDGEFCVTGALTVTQYPLLGVDLRREHSRQKGCERRHGDVLANFGGRYGQIATITVNEFAYSLRRIGRRLLDEDVTIGYVSIATSI